MQFHCQNRSDAIYSSRIYYSLIFAEPTQCKLRGVLEEIALLEPAVKTAKVEHFIDASFITKLDQSGFIDGLYKKK